MLHGEIKINDHEFTSWAVSNTQEKENGVSVYAATVNYTDRAGYSHTASFTVLHNPGDGAMLLVARILDEASRRIGP